MNILPLQTTMQGKQYSTFEFDTNNQAMQFMDKNNKEMRRYSCCESGGKYYVCYYYNAEKPHGGAVEHIQDAFHDVTRYADGHTERFYIGD